MNIYNDTEFTKGTPNRLGTLGKTKIDNKKYIPIINSKDIKEIENTQEESQQSQTRNEYANFVKKETESLSKKVNNLHNAYVEYLDVEQVLLFYIFYIRMFYVH